jgi:hypothetical protein
MLRAVPSLPCGRVDGAAKPVPAGTVTLVAQDATGFAIAADRFFNFDIYRS